ncbi:MAG: MFS transporter [Candidatus Lokiarchaeota archaeon]|nr:MFS transporter [Candidatus Lokiarchaeota archaeon]
MSEMENGSNRKLKKFGKFVGGQVVVLGLLFFADQIFGFAEAEYLNTYITEVLGFPYKYVARMVSISALMGLITNIIWGIVSDNTRSKFGRRKPYLFFGGVISGIFMVLFAFSLRIAGGDPYIAYIICIIIDGVIIGISSNAYYVAERSLLPDLVEPRLRGRANGIVEIIGYIGMIVIVGASIVTDPLFGGLNETAHFFLLSLGGGIIIIVSILAMLLVKEKPVDNLPPKTPFFRDLVKIFNVKELGKNREFLKIILAMTVFRIGIMIIMPYIMIYLITTLELPLIDMLLAILAAFGGTFILIAIIGRITDKYGRKRFLSLFIVISSIFFFGMPFVQGGWNFQTGGAVNLILLLILIPFVVFGILGLITPMQAWSQDLLPIESRGKFLGVLNLVFTIPQIIGAHLGALIADNFGVEYIFWLAPIFFLVSIPFFLWVKETLKKE